MIYAIADLHLDYTEEKSMEVFGEKWEDYQERIFKNWQEIVTDQDTVLIPGDISWAMNIEDAKIDLEKIDKLNGRKIMLRGNHDYRWSSLKKLNDLNLSTIDFLQNNSFEVEDYLICGSRGRISKDNKNFDDHDEKIYKRELLRLKNSLEYEKTDKKKIVMTHYPPLNYDKSFNDFFYLCKDYKVEHLIYGHLHGKGHNLIVEGEYEGIKVKCVAGDYLDFKVERIC